MKPLTEHRLLMYKIGRPVLNCRRRVAINRHRSLLFYRCSLIIHQYYGSNGSRLLSEKQFVQKSFKGDALRCNEDQGRGEGR